MKSKPSAFMKRNEFLKCLLAVYGEQTTDYLLALRDGLSVIINIRLNPNAMPIDSYQGYVKYI